MENFPLFFLLGSLGVLITMLTKDTLIEEKQVLCIKEPHKKMTLPDSKVLIPS